MTLLELLSALRARDVNLWVDGERLRYSAPAGVMSSELREELARHKATLFTFLQHTDRLPNAPHTPIPKISRRERSTPAPLSCAQQRLWFLHQWDPQSPAYNEAIARRLRGALDVSALRRALNEIAARHEILRTKIAAEGETPAQMINSAGAVEFAVMDLRAEAASRREDEARRLMIETIRRPFDLTHDFPWRVLLVQLADDEHLLLASMHHIAFDGWSSQIFWSELAILYGAFKAGQPSPLEELPVQYQHYAEWQSRQLQSEALERQVSYWKHELDGIAILQLPTDHPRPAVQSWHGAKQTMLFPKEQAEQLKTLSRAEGATFFMTLLAAFQTLLYRYTSQDDIAVGCPVAGRTRPELENLIGFFINTLVMRAQVRGEISFREFLRRVRETALSAYECQDVPFERLVEQLQPQRDLSRNPLFQVTFQLRNFLQTPAPMAGLTSEPVQVDAGIAKFDLALRMTDSPRGLAADLEYNTDLFAAATAKRLLGHFGTLLQGIADDPEQRLSELPILTEQKKRQLLLEWNEAERAYPTSKCLHRLFEEQVERTPDAVAVTFEGQQFSYQELNQRANRWAHCLQERGVGPDGLVGVCMERSLEMVVAVLAILKAGGAYVPLDPRHPTERLRSIIDDARLRLVLTRRHWMEAKKSRITERDNSGAEIEWLCIDSDSNYAQSADNPDGEIDSKHLAYVIYTSGSTGRPKGVSIEHQQIVNYLYGISETCGLAPGASYAMVQPLSVDSSHTAVFPPLIFGGVLHVISEERALDSEALADYFTDFEIDFLKIAPSHLAALQQSSTQPERLLPRRWLVIGGEPSHPAWVEGLRRMGSCAIFNHYGPTEATVGMLTYPVTNESSAAASVTVPLGRPLPNTQAYVLDGRRNLVPIGVVGELYIGGDCLARGYLNLPQQTAESFVQHAFDGLAVKRLYRTGDRVRYRDDGNIEFLGRIDHQVKIRGFRVEPAEIEAALREHEGIRAAVVQAQEDPSGENRLVAYVVVQSGEVICEDTLTEFLKRRLPDYMVPARIVFLEALPLTAHGKVDLQALPPAPERRRADADVVAPRSATEKLLAHIWTEVLGLASVGVHDDFFALGGHSLKAMQILSRLRAALDHTIPLRHLFEYPTIAQLAAALDVQLAPKKEEMSRLLNEIEAVSEQGALREVEDG